MHPIAALAVLRDSLRDCLVCGCIARSSGAPLLLSAVADEIAREASLVALAAGEIAEAWKAGAGAVLTGTDVGDLKVVLMQWRERLYFVAMRPGTDVGIIFGYPATVNVAMALTEAKEQVPALEQLLPGAR